MITQTSFIRGHRKYLDEEFIKKYPNGQFAIQCRRDKINLYVNFRRRTSGSHPLYPGAFGIECANGNHFHFVRGQNNSFGKVTIYKTLDKFLAACIKYSINKKAIKEFLFFYSNRNVPFIVEKVKGAIYFCTKIHKSTVPGRNDPIWKK